MRHERLRHGGALGACGSLFTSLHSQDHNCVLNGLSVFSTDCPTVQRIINRNLRFCSDQCRLSNAHVGRKVMAAPAGLPAPAPVPSLFRPGPARFPKRTVGAVRTAIPSQAGTPTSARARPRRSPPARAVAAMRTTPGPPACFARGEPRCGRRGTNAIPGLGIRLADKKGPALWLRNVSSWRFRGRAYSLARLQHDAIDE